MDIKKLKPLEELLDSVRGIDGFPIGKDEDILNLSNAPYYTACPNPYINDFIEEYGKPYDAETDTYERKPFVGDVSEGKGDPIYNIHTYHTKVPPKAISSFVEHYTDVDDIVMDLFSGSGMTGVGVQLANRNVILSDISPIASFISNNHNINTFEALHNFKMEAHNILISLKEELGWMYTTKVENELVIYDYVVWSEEFLCPFCGEKIKFSIEEEEILKVNSECPVCKADIGKNPKKSKVVYNDKYVNHNFEHTLLIPLEIHYKIGKKKYKKLIDEYDLQVLEKIDNMEIPYKFPLVKIPNGHNTNQPINTHGYNYIHHLYTKRNLWSSAFIMDRISNIEDKKTRDLLMFWFTSLCIGQTKMNRYFESSFSQVNRYLKGTLYIGKKISEVNPLYSFINKIDVIYKNLNFSKRNAIVSVNSATQLMPSENSIDYIFTDPPFGSNIMYSELNFIWESWLSLKTNKESEAIVNDFDNKTINDYGTLMYNSFKEAYRVLKPNRWITVVFHNSKAAIWNTIQSSLTKAGFVIAQVGVLDKQQDTFKQMTAPNSVKNDLVINAYKPKDDFNNRFIITAGEGMEIDFVKQQFDHLPIEPNIERTESRLYPKMLAYYLENGFKIKYNSQNFFELLEENFIEVDGYWFDESEINQYNEWKSKQGNLDKVKDLKSGMMIMFITDEKSALQWIYTFLDEPKTYSEIYTAYQKIATTSNDSIPELKELLDNNFFTTDGKYRRPDTRQERKEMAKNREKELEKAWKKMFEKLTNEKKKIKNIRKEALLYGLQKCYDQENYKDILIVADKLHASILEENSDISDFIDIAMIKSETNKEGTLF